MFKGKKYNQYSAGWSQEEKELLRKNYTRLPRAELQRILPKRTWKTMIRMAGVLGCTGRPRNQKLRGYNAKRKVDIDFFKKMGDVQAYVLGRFITDGSWRLRKTGGEIRLKSIDKENLEKIRFVMGSNHKIRKVKTPNGTWIYVLDIFSNELVRDLIRIVEGRKMEFIESHHFLRGLIDGDGSIGIHKGKLRAQLSNGDEELLRAIQANWGGVIYLHGSLEVLEWWGDQAEEVCRAIYGESMPFLCIARKFSRWQLWQAMKQSKLTT